jgi:hypothetical protein
LGDSHGDLDSGWARAPAASCLTPAERWRHVLMLLEEAEARGGVEACLSPHVECR